MMSMLGTMALRKGRYFLLSPTGVLLMILSMLLDWFFVVFGRRLE